MVEWSKQPKDKWPKWQIAEKKQVNTGDTNRVFYEAKLVAGEGSYPKNREQIIAIGNIVKEESFSTLRRLVTVTAWLLLVVSY